ncbi:acyl-CoA dehydrogenase, N-terminal domain protein [Mycobacterium xenopi 3993]|nr:acyl-CoA dehydrogenase, N-terminal domain protein [Mycobacterium xenopi 3993]
MNLLPSAEQLEIVSATAQFLEQRMPVQHIRADRHAKSVVRADVWRDGAQMGLLTLGLPEDLGGLGRAFDDEVLLHIELGKHLAPGPFLAGTLAARLAAVCGDAERADEIGSGAH